MAATTSGGYGRRVLEQVGVFMILVYVLWRNLAAEYDAMCAAKQPPGGAR